VTRTVRRALAVGALALLAVSACSAAPQEPPATPTATVTPSPSPSRAAAPSPEAPPTVLPLTGEPVDEIPERPALSVKVENTSAARPQAGLDEADIVWETVVEFSVPRFIAVFHSRSPEKIGPIRSVRPMDPAIIKPMGGILAASGGQSGILSLVRRSGAQLLTFDAGHPGFYRSRDRVAPHNVYSSAKDLWDQADGDRTAPPPQQFEYAHGEDEPSAVALGEKASTLSLRMGQGRPSWTWDPGTGAWLRSESGAAASVEGGSRLSAVNVVVLSVEAYDSGYDAQGGAAVPNLRLAGERGKAWVATGGKVLEGRWSKEAEEEPFVLTVKGEPLLLAPGQTWVEVMPTNEGSFDFS